MDKSFEIIRSSRRNFIKLLEGLSIEQLNEVPSGLRNNLVWNLGHIVVSQQVLCYHFSNLKTEIDERYILRYKMGTKPEGFIGRDEVDLLIACSTSLIDQLELDLNANIFKTFNSFRHPFYDVEINNINDAVAVIAYHDGLHIGYSMVIKRQLSNI